MLSDMQCRNAKPKVKSYKLRDENGLYLEIKPNGVKSWRYRFELFGEGRRKESVFAIGNYVRTPAGETIEGTKIRRNGGHFTLVETREERAKARALVKEGIKLAHHRNLERLGWKQDSAKTFEAVAREWLALRDWEEVTKSKRLNMVTRVVFPKTGPLPIKQIIPAHILDVLTAAAKMNGLTVAAEARQTMPGVFELSVPTLRAEGEPVYPVRKAQPVNKTQHERPLSIEEIGQLMRILDCYGRKF